MAERIKYGPAVVNGVPQYFSPSGLTVADTASEGCLRKWYFQYLRGIKSPSTKAQVRGTNLHSEVEDYMKTGNRSLSTLALSGLHMVPPPGPGLGIELDIAGGSLATAPLRAAGIPVMGYIDLVHARGTNQGATSLEDTIDPPNTIEVCDWKTTSDSKWIKSPREMARTIQMTTYGKWALTVEPKIEHVRLSHGYFVERGGPSRKVTLRVLPEFVESNWQLVEAVARTVVDVAKETDPDRVPANISVCDRFGGCPAKSVCKARMHVALANFVGQSAADKLLGKAQEPEVGLLDKMKAAQAAQAGAVPATVVTTPTETSVSVGIGALLGGAPPDLAAEKTKLEAEEIAQRAAAQLRAHADKFAPVLARLEAYAAANPDIGMPSFTGDAAIICCVVKGISPTIPLPGRGKLVGAEVTDQATAESVVSQLDQYAAAGQIKAPSAPGGGIAGLLAPDAPSPSVPAIVTPSSSTTSPAETLAPTPPPAAESEKKTRAKKPKTEPSSTASTTEVVPVDPTLLVSFTLIVDAVVEGFGPIQSFHPILDAICAELATMGSDLDLRAAGIRAGADGKVTFAKDDSLFAFGRGDGALAALLRERDLPGGVYCLDTRGNRLAEIAADALREKCRRTGGMFVWGRR